MGGTHRRRTGILGGTFDPPHVGHLRVASAVGEALGLDSVVLMVAGDPWQKSDLGEVTPAEDRLAMVEAMLRDASQDPDPDSSDAGVPVVASDLEIRRGGRTYTVETLEQLRAEDPERELVLILGADAAAGLHTWHRHMDLPGLCDIAVVRRPGSGEDPELSPPTDLPHVVVEAPLVDVSSSDLRERIRSGAPVDGLVTAGVISVMTERGLYAGSDDGD